jgi:hypothetical protein
MDRAESPLRSVRGTAQKAHLPPAQNGAEPVDVRHLEDHRGPPHVPGRVATGDEPDRRRHELTVEERELNPSASDELPVWRLPVALRRCEPDPVPVEMPRLRKVPNEESRAVNLRRKSSPGHGRSIRRAILRVGRTAPEGHYARASNTRLNGVSTALRTRVKPPSRKTWWSSESDAWAPSPRPTSWESEAGTQTRKEAL